MIEAARWVAATAALVALLAGCSRGDGDSGFDADLAAKLQQTLDDERRRFAAPGASAAIAVPGEGVWAGASGVADARTGDPVTRETLFAFGSVTKTFVAALVLDLAEDDVLGLDQRLATWLPEFPRAREITIRQLLNHTSGVHDVTENAAFFEAQLERPHERWTAERTLRHVLRPYFRPGTDWRYSNTNYVLLGRVIEEATRSRVSHELRRRLLRRAGAAAVFVQGEERLRRPVARAYVDFDGDGDEDPLSDGTNLIPNTAMATAAWTAGGIAATPTAVARFGDALFRRRLLERSSLRTMLSFDERLGTGRGGGLGYGFGVARFQIPRHEVFGHGGGIPGFRAALWHAPEHGVTIAFVWTDERLDPTLVVQPLLDAVVQHVER